MGSDLVARLAAQPGAKVIASDRDQSDLEGLSRTVKEATMAPADTQDHEAVSSNFFMSLGPALCTVSCVHIPDRKYIWHAPLSKIPQSLLSTAHDQLV